MGGTRGTFETEPLGGLQSDAPSLFEFTSERAVFLQRKRRMVRSVEIVAGVKGNFLDDDRNEKAGGEELFAILVVEDDRGARTLMEKVLTQNGFDPVVAENVEEALKVLEARHVNLIVLDIMLPGTNGYEFAEMLRDSGWDIPILMVTALEDIEDKKRGFRSGTDDYMVKPVNHEELILRIRALLRRYRISLEHQLTVGNTIFNYDGFSVERNGESMTLPKKEFQIIYKLLSYPNRIFTRLQIMDEVWGMDNDTDFHSVDVHINRLRNRFKDNDDFEIVTIRGLGYKVMIHEKDGK